MESGIRVRRARRDDFDRIHTLIAGDAPPTRAARKRFRRLVGSLREDCYVAERADDRRLVGVMVVVYARALGPSTATVRRLLGVEDAMAPLLARARTLAAARRCTVLELLVPAEGVACEPALLAAGWLPGLRVLVQEVES
jgi:hypothetical protein